jgi:Ni/Co efflux regulator RcnB
MKKLVFGAVALAVLAAPAFAQNKDDDPLMVLEREKKQQAERLDQQYKRTLDRTRKENETARSDPWANMRAPKEDKR